MFYAHFVLAKKGPLARIWLAAHWDKKLTKAHVFETNIEKSVDGILQPKVKMALRTSGHLLLGVVRIYSRKAKYLLADCNEAFVKIKMAFRPGMVDLPEDHREANVNAITLPEVFHFDTAMPELNDVDIQAQFSLNQSRAEEITMREDYGSMALAGSSAVAGASGSEGLGVDDEGFGDMLGFDRGEPPPELLRDASNVDQANLLFSDHSVPEQPEVKDRAPSPNFPRPSTSTAAQPMDIDIPIRDDGFGGHLGQDMIGGGLFEGGLFDDAPLGAPELPPEGSSVQEEAARAAAAAAALVGIPGTSGKASDLPVPHSDDSDDDAMDHYGGPPSPMGGHSDDDDNSRPGSGLLSEHGLNQVAAAASLVLPSTSVAELSGIPDPVGADPFGPGPGMEDRVVDQTTLLHNEDESFALAPVDAATLKGLSKAKRKRKLIVDEVKNISGEEMKAQLSDTSDIVTTLDLAPPTKRLMHWKETGGVEKLFALPGRPIPARQLFKCYLRHLTSKGSENEDFGTFGDLDRELLPLEQVRGAEAPLLHTSLEGIPEEAIAPATPAPPKSRPGRKRKLQELEDNQQIAQLMEPPQTPLAPPSVADLSSLLNPPEHEQEAINNPPSVVAAVVAAVAAAAVPPTPELIPPQTPLATETTLDQTQLALGHSLVEDVSTQQHSLQQSMQQTLEHSMQPGMPPTLQPDLQQPLDQSIQQNMLEETEVPSVPQPTDLPAMENLGYDQTAPLMANMGYDEHLPPAVTPGAISERGVHTPWHEDCEEFPGSVGPPEEQMTDETYEQFEERVLNKRAAHMYHIVKSKLERPEHHSRLFFSEMTARNNRKQVAQKFYTLLVLKKYEAVELAQDKSYDDILITPGAKFDNNVL